MIEDKNNPTRHNPNYRTNFIDGDLKTIAKYIPGSKFIIETGTGVSTEYIHKALDSDAKFYTVDIDDIKYEKLPDVNYKVGWTVTYEDFIKKDDPRYYVSKYNGMDKRVIEEEDPTLIIEEDDILRKILAENPDEMVDFFFSDSGEYCGLPEWEIVKDRIKIGGIFAAHDIYHPKSIKNFQVVNEIKNSDNWKILDQTATRQGLLVAKKIK